MPLTHTPSHQLEPGSSAKLELQSMHSWFDFANQPRTGLLLHSQNSLESHVTPHTSVYVSAFTETTMADYRCQQLLLSALQGSITINKQLLICKPFGVDCSLETCFVSPLRNTDREDSLSQRQTTSASLHPRYAFRFCFVLGFF